DLPELPARLRWAVNGEVVPAGPGLAGTLARVRDTIAANAGSVPPTEPVEWVTADQQPGDPKTLTPVPAHQLARLHPSATWTPPGPDGFFEALKRAGEHDQPRLLGLGGWAPAELRSIFATLLQLDLAAAGDAWPLLDADATQLPERRAELLPWMARLATPG